MCIRDRYIIADEKGIDMDFTVNDLTDLAMENGHLVVLLSNLMDNAIEACERVESGREVRASFLLQDNEVFLSGPVDKVAKRPILW